MIDYLAIGHLTVDRLDSGIAPGGSATYATTTAARLGLRTGILTTAGTELDWSLYLPGSAIALSPAAASTTFENRYHNGSRTQKLLSLAPAVSTDSLPGEWKRPAIVHLAPVVHEVGASFARLFPEALVAITPQGLLRHWDEDGRVRQGEWIGEDGLLGNCDVAIFSEEDVAGDRTFLAMCVQQVEVVAFTRGPRGATLFWGGLHEDFPAFSVREVDPTGAGDVFAAAFLIEYNLTKDPRRSAAFACCAASFAVEQTGMAGVPDRAAVEQRLRQYHSLRSSDE